MSEGIFTSGTEAGVPWINASGEESGMIQSKTREIASQISNWVSNTRRSPGGSLFQRQVYSEPGSVFDQIRIARHAVSNDDVVSAAADVQESLAFQGIAWESDDTDEADAFNQINRDLDLDAFVRAAYREMLTCSQVVVASWWARKSYTVRGYSAPAQTPLVAETDEFGATKYVEPLDPKTHRPLKPKRGAKRRKTFDLYAPTRLSILDPLRVIPVGGNLWGAERLAWQATNGEMEVWDALADMPMPDATMITLVLGRYEPGTEEKAHLEAMGVDTTRLLELNPERVWRLTAPKPSHQPWADIRLKSTFKLLDLKAQLMEADRVSLVGAANYILLVKKGSELSPAYAEEIDNLKEGFSTVAKLPVIVSDHRLEIEIITPATDVTLKAEKYDTLDRRIAARMFGLPLSSGDAEPDAGITARMIARKLENERHQLKRFLEANLGKRIADANDAITEGAPSLAFTPRNVQLNEDSQLIQSVMALRTQKEISRETVLEFFGFDQDVEMQRRIQEEESGADEIFGTKVPFDSPTNTGGNAGGLPPGAFGPTGGRPTGGGQPSQNTTAPGKAAR